MLDSFFNAIFGWAINLSPLWGLVIIAFILTFLITLVYKFATDQNALKSMKDEMKQIRTDMKEFKKDPEKMMELQKKSMSHSMSQMKMTLKPMIITFIPIVIIFGWLRATYADLSINLLGITSFFWIYVIISIITSITLRKLLKVQ